MAWALHQSTCPSLDSLGDRRKKKLFFWTWLLPVLSNPSCVEMITLLLIWAGGSCFSSLWGPTNRVTFSVSWRCHPPLGSASSDSATGKLLIWRCLQFLHKACLCAPHPHPHPRAMASSSKVRSAMHHSTISAHLSLRYCIQTSRISYSNLIAKVLLHQLC